MSDQTAHSRPLPIDLNSETLLTLTSASRRFRLDRPVNPSTVWRWVKKGVRLPDGRRLKLEAIRLGGRWWTSLEAIERCSKSGLPKVIGVASLAVGPADAARGAKSEKRRPSAIATPEGVIRPTITAPPATTRAHVSWCMYVLSM